MPLGTRYMHSRLLSFSVSVWRAFSAEIYLQYANMRGQFIKTGKKTKPHIKTKHSFYKTDIIIWPLQAQREENSIYFLFFIGLMQSPLISMWIFESPRPMFTSFGVHCRVILKTVFSLALHWALPWLHSPLVDFHGQWKLSIYYKIAQQLPVLSSQGLIVSHRLWFITGKIGIALDLHLGQWDENQAYYIWKVL